MEEEEEEAQRLRAKVAGYPRPAEEAEEAEEEEPRELCWGIDSFQKHFARPLLLNWAPCGRLIEAVVEEVRVAHCSYICKGRIHCRRHLLSLSDFAVDLVQLENCWMEKAQLYS